MSRNVVGPSRKLIESITKRRHGEMIHRGWKLVFKDLKKENFNKNNLQQKVWENVIGRQICVRRNVSNKITGTKHNTTETSRRNQLLCLDVWGLLPMTYNGKRFCLAAIHHFSMISYVKPIYEIKWEI
jgi:hypothetical protein